jgi:hypothetical protein
MQSFGVLHEHLFRDCTQGYAIVEQCIKGLVTMVLNSVIVMIKGGWLEATWNLAVVTISKVYRRYAV